jgi:hypothetical protein
MFNRKEYMKDYNKNYQQTEKYKEYKKRYRHSVNGKRAHRKGQNKYLKTEKGKLAVRKNHAHIRSLGYNELCKNPYPKDIKIAYHHINNLDVIPIPSSIHDKFSGNGVSLERHQMEILNWIKEHYPIKTVGV